MEKAPETIVKVAAFSGGAASVLGALGLSGWITGLRTLASLRSEFVPMAPDTGLLFLALGAILFSGAYRRDRGLGRSLSVAVAGLASFYGALKTVETLIGIDLTLQSVLFPDTERLGAIVLGRMSPVTGVLFFLSGIAILARIFGRARRLTREAASGLGAIVLITGFVATAGYLFGTPFLYGGTVIPLAATTAAAFLFLGIGMMAAAGMETVLTRRISGPSASARLLRGILPAIILVILLDDVLGSTLASAFGIDRALLSAVLTLASTAAAVIIVVRIARNVFRRAERAEAERRRAEDALRRSEKRFRQIVENEGDFIWEVDANGLYTYASPIIEKILGFRPDELVGKFHFYDLFAPDVREELKAAVMASFARKDSFRGFVNPNIRKDGVYVILETSGAPIIGESGAFLGYRGIDKDITERKRTEEQLFIKGFALESSMSAIGLSDMEGRLIYANDAYVKLWGYQRAEEILGMPITAFAVSKEQVRDVVASLKAEKPYVGEGISRRTDGTEFQIQLSANLVTSHDGRPLCMMASFVDVTPRKRAELLQRAAYRIAQAAERATGLAGLFKAVHEIIGTVMPARNFYISLYHKEAGLLSFPYFVDEIDVAPPAAIPAKGLTEYVLRTGEALLCDREADRVLRDRGDVEMVGPPSAVWLGVPLKADGQTIGVMVVQHYSDPGAYGPEERRMLEFVSSQVARSIERTRAEEALQESEKRYRLLTENMKDVVWILDPETDRFTYVSPSVLALCGYTPEETITRPAHEALTVEAATAIVAGIPERIASFLAEPGRDHSFRTEVPQVRKDGSIVWTDVITRFYRDEATGKVLVHGVSRDITERKRAEEALQDSFKQKEILMKELQHRVKNSLAVVSGLLGLGMETLTDERAKGIFTETRSRLRSIASLYEQLSGTGDPVSVDLGSYFRTLAEAIFKTYTAGTGDIRLKMTLGEVRLDTKRAVPLGLILNELITNALKYAYPAGATGEVRVDLERSGDTVAFGVSDDGPGLPAGFDPKTSGGMGWSLVRMLTEEIGGELTCPAVARGVRVLIRFTL